MGEGGGGEDPGAAVDAALLGLLITGEFAAAGTYDSPPAEPTCFPVNRVKRFTNVA